MGAMSELLGGKKLEKSGETHSHFLNVVPGIKCGTLAVFLTFEARAVPSACLGFGRKNFHTVGL